MTALELREAIATKLRAEFSGVEVISHGGRFDAEELRRWSIKAPALVVMCVAADGVNDLGGIPSVPWRFAVVVVTKSTAKAKRDEVALGLVEAVLHRVHGNRWGAENVDAPDQVLAENLFSAPADKEGIALWGMRWSQAVHHEPALEGAALLRAMGVEYRPPGEERALATDEISFAHEEAEP